MDDLTLVRCDILCQILIRHAIHSSHSADIGVDFFLCNRQSFDFSNGFQRSACFGSSFSLRLHLRLEVILRNALILEELLQRNILCHQILRKGSKQLIDKGFCKCVSQLNLCICHNLIQDCLLCLRVSLLLLLLRHGLTDVLTECIHIRCMVPLCKQVIQLRQLLFLYLMHLALEYDRFASQIFCMVILREGHVDIHGISCGSADQLLLKARNKGTGTQLQRIVFRCAAFKLLLTEETGKINDYGVTQRSRTVYGFQPCTFLLFLEQGSLNFFICNGNSYRRPLNTLVCTENNGIILLTHNKMNPFFFCKRLA